MIMDYITIIKANITIYASKKTSNILDGEYTSIYKGRSMDFDDLREYVIGDDVKDIDWKSSIRSGKTLVRRFIAEKKHNILLVLDSEKKMLADTANNESKKELAILSAGTIAYLAHRHGDEIGAVYSKENYTKFFNYKTTLFNLEMILQNYNKDVQANNGNINTSLNFIIKNIKRKSIIVIVTDLDGLDKLQEETIKRLSVIHDILVINISDASLTCKNAFDIDAGSYIPELILQDSKLLDIEKRAKEETYKRCMEKFKKYKITVVTISQRKEIVQKIIELLERHKHANIS